MMMQNSEGRCLGILSYFFAAGHVSIARGIEALWALFVQPRVVLVKNSCAERLGYGR